VSSSETLEEEWERLRAERRMLRDRVAASASGVLDKARDPFGLRSAIRRHPLAAAVTAGGLAAVLSALVARRRTARTAEPEEDTGSLNSMLKKAAIGVAVPWLARFVQQRFSAADGTQPHEGNGSAQHASSGATT
jgi:hypothetical protein